MSDQRLQQVIQLAHLCRRRQAAGIGKHRQWIATIGSVGQPRDGNPRARYAVFDSTACKLTFHRVAYDHLSAAAAIRKAGLPEFFADRLERGR